MKRKLKYAIIDVRGENTAWETRNERVELIPNEFGEYFFFYGNSWVDYVNEAQRDYKQYQGTGGILNITIKQFIYDTGNKK